MRVIRHPVNKGHKYCSEEAAHTCSVDNGHSILKHMAKGRFSIRCNLRLHEVGE